MKYFPNVSWIGTKYSPRIRILHYADIGNQYSINIGVKYRYNIRSLDIAYISLFLVHNALVDNTKSILHRDLRKVLSKHWSAHIFPTYWEYCTNTDMKDINKNMHYKILLYRIYFTSAKNISICIF